MQRVNKERLSRKIRNGFCQEEEEREDLEIPGGKNEREGNSLEWIDTEMERKIKFPDIAAIIQIVIC